MERGLGLGMCRLAIQDVAHGHQPYISEDGRIIAVFNGEIYNYPQLRSILVMKGHHLRSRADGEVLVHLYEEYGQDFLAHLSGMFAVAVWDKKSRQLLLARDRIGQKPLYLLNTPDTLAFASEIKAFMGVDGYYPAVDEQALPAYLGHRYVPAPQTLLHNVTKLRPGEVVRIGRDGKWHRQLYWDLPLQEAQDQGSLGEWAQKLEQLLRGVVHSHLAADVPIGLFLSGGVDSSLLAALAAREYDGRLETWSGGFSSRYPQYEEFRWAKQVASAQGLPIHTVDVGQLVSPQRVRELAYILDEPMADPTVLPLDGLVAAASRNHRVILTGEGADEVFGGYAGYGEVESLRWLSQVPPGIRQWWVKQGWKGAGALTRAAIPVSERYRGVGFTFSGLEQSNLLAPDLAFPDRAGAVREYWRDAAGIAALQAMQGFDVRWFLGDDVLLKTDRIGMHHHVEVRAPYCDHQIVQLAFQIPLDLRRGAYHDKRVLRQVAERYLPNAIVYRRKKGFPTPLTALMAGPFYRAAYDSLTDDRFIHRGWFRPDAVQSLLSRLGRRNPTIARQIYALWMLELWMEELVEKPAIPRVKSSPCFNARGQHPTRQ